MPGDDIRRIDWRLFGRTDRFYLKEFERSQTLQTAVSELEGDLTALELQWGRTIGQTPSPYTAGNPLIAPYRWDQGK